MVIKDIPIEYQTIYTIELLTLIEEVVVRLSTLLRGKVNLLVRRLLEKADIILWTVGIIIAILTSTRHLWRSNGKKTTRYK